ncbi:hypothetical protein [Pseudomonas poae]|uniref:Ead/Ea22-like family protein n=1 Tax=Pseudomonas poae TaxID=200451 RepID=A0AAP2WGA9_9PSED|nr:hypothetical protein [Pseudomonas poae]MCF5656090.1 hypothetical protein [Pseudomonas poae]
MADYSELKRLAEAFPADLDWDSNTEPFFNGPSGESLGGGSTGFYCVYGAPFEIDGEQYDGHRYVETCKADFAKFMVAARDGVLALIAENERLERLALDSVNAEYAANMDLESVCAERDQLRAEVVGLKTGYEAYERVNAELKAENEALRKHAERYRWLRDSECAGRILRDMGAKVCRHADQRIDAAMGKGEQS